MVDFSETYNQIDSGVQDSQKLLMGNSPIPLKKLLIFFAVVTFFSWYAYVVFFGQNSYSLVKELEVDKLELQIQIVEIKSQNTKLQRSYFNLKVANESYRDGL